MACGMEKEAGGEVGGWEQEGMGRGLYKLFFLREISVSFEVIERSDQLRDVLVQTPKNIFPAVAVTVYFIAEGVYFERIS
jgi:hypothetical protein